MTYTEKVNFLRREFEKWDIAHFSALEIIRGWNVPMEYLHNIIPTAKVLEFVRNYFAIPIYVLSTYRDKEYNRIVGGARRSLHLVFNAIDFTVKNKSKLKDICELLEDIDAGKFRGFTFLPKPSGNLGIGLYPTFIHLDTRSLLERDAPARWVKRL